MEPYPDPLAAGEPPGALLGNALAPLTPPPAVTTPAATAAGDLAYFGDALAAPAAGADPTAAPMNALAASVFGPDGSGSVGGIGGSGGSGGVGRDMAGTQPGSSGAGRAEIPAYEVVGFPAADADDPLDPPTMSFVVPGAVRQPAEGGRYELGLPRGWDPPTVPANRGWRTAPAPAPAPQRRRRPTQQLPGQRPTATRGARPGQRGPAPSRGAPAGRPNQPVPASAPPGRAIPPELADLLVRRGRQSDQWRAVFWTRFGLAVVLGLLGFAAGINHNWPAVAIFAGLLLILLRPRPKPAR